MATWFSPREALIAEVAGLRTSAIDVRRRDQHSDLFLKEQPLSILQWIPTAPQHWWISGQALSTVDCWFRPNPSQELEMQGPELACPPYPQTKYF
jgi:hypothetical protein